MKTEIVNLFAGPGAGKSTFATMLFSKLKMQGVECEYVPEYAKKLTWFKRVNSLECQPYVFGKQLHEIEGLIGQVNYVITDSPILLSAMYAGPKWPDSFTHSVIDIFQSMSNINLFIDRTKKYNPNGRNQTEDEARAIDSRLMLFLVENCISYEKIYANEENADKIASWLISRQKGLDTTIAF